VRVCQRCEREKPASHFQQRATIREDGALAVERAKVCKDCAEEVADDFNRRAEAQSGET
jgi:hypothetical protein